MSANVVSISSGPRWRVLIAHQRHDVRHVLRTLIETEHTAIVEVDDGEAAMAALEHARFDLLLLELDLPRKDGVTVMQLHRLLLAHEGRHVEPPDVVLALSDEVGGNSTLTDYLRSLGVAGFIDAAPRADTAALVESVLEARASARVSGKPAAA